MTTLQWRSLVSGLACVPGYPLLSFPVSSLLTVLFGAVCLHRSGGWYFINFYANGKISADMVAGPGWRWGYGIYALCYIPALTPIVSGIHYRNSS